MLKMLLGTSNETEKTLVLFYYDSAQEGEYYILEVPDPARLKFRGSPTAAARSLLTEAIDMPMVPHFYVFREFELDGVVYQPVQFGFYLSPDPIIKQLGSAPYALIPRSKHLLGDPIRRANLISC